MIFIKSLAPKPKLIEKPQVLINETIPSWILEQKVLILFFWSFKMSADVNVPQKLK